ncbi:glycoside hydrolase family 3 protein, partial [Halobium palmae]
MDRGSPVVRERVEKLTRKEKIRLVHGAADPEGISTGYVPGVERLGIPEYRLSDGPLGVRVLGEPATAFPAPIALAATFDTELARRKGVTLGREAKGLEQDAILGPGVNLIRVPHCGRNFEYYSEDPVVTASFARAAVEGIQSEDVVATPKHYVANNQESNRASVSARVSDRALRECYLPGFEAAVDAGAGSVMTAYNRVNGVHMSDHRTLLTDVLKEEWGFDGYTVSDWYGVTSTVGAANAGLDLEMPGITREAMWSAWGLEENVEGVFGESEEIEGGMPDPSNTRRFAEALAEAVDAGDVPESRLNDMVSRILGRMEAIGLFDESRDDGQVGGPEHRELARTIAARGTVLLENDGALPLADDVDVAVVGPGIRDAKLGGGGSSEMEALDPVSTVDGVRERATGEVRAARGVPEIEQFSFFGGLQGEDSSGPDPVDTDA